MSGSPVVPDHLAVARVRPDDANERSAVAALAIDYSRRYGGTSCRWFARLREHPGVRLEF
jgi:hypothetical protein